MTGGRARLSSRVIGDSGCVYRAGDLGWVTQGKSTITPSSPTATEEYLHLCRGRHVPPPEKPYMCAQTLQPTPSASLACYEGSWNPPSRQSEACHVTCHVKFGVSCQIIPQLILTRGRIIQWALEIDSLSLSLEIYLSFVSWKDGIEDEEKQLEEAREVFYSLARCS